jgi:hypothetical protein
MSASELTEKSLDYLQLFGPYLLIFFAIAFAEKIIDLMFFSINAFRKRG